MFVWPPALLYKTPGPPGLITPNSKIKQSVWTKVQNQLSLPKKLPNHSSESKPEELSHVPSNTVIKNHENTHYRSSKKRLWAKRPERKLKRKNNPQKLVCPLVQKKKQPPKTSVTPSMFPQTLLFKNSLQWLFQTSRICWPGKMGEKLWLWLTPI